MDVAKVLEDLANKGYCPALVFNDDGYWALTCDGMQSLDYDAIMKNEPFEMHASFIIPKESFKPSIEEAVQYFLDNDK
jgi:hypothetical protein